MNLIKYKFHNGKSVATLVCVGLFGDNRSLCFCALASVGALFYFIKFKKRGKKMALIKCSECGNMFSSFALCCPQCGCPISKINLSSKIYLIYYNDVFFQYFPLDICIGKKKFHIEKDDLDIDYENYSENQKAKNIYLGEIHQNDCTLNENGQFDITINYHDRVFNNIGFDCDIRDLTDTITGFSLGKTCAVIMKCESINTGTSYEDYGLDDFVRFEGCYIN